MRYLVLDVGDRWIGLALGDSAANLTTPLRTMRRSSRQADLETLRRACEAEGVEAIVVGLPRNMDGSLGPQARRTMAFAEALRVLEYPVEFCDERLSSVAAQEYVTTSRGRPPRPGERIDHVAAAIILQDHLDASS